MTRVRICSVLQRSSGFVVVPSRYPERLGTFSTKNTEIRWSVTAQFTWTKSHATMVEA
jgi:hypothetical protein